MEQKTDLNSLDRRQRKTRLAIHNALIELMASKPIDKITVSELAKKADINRKTFYNHYATIQDVRHEIDQQFIDTLFSFADQSSPEDLVKDPYPFLHQLVTALNRDRFRAKMLFDSGETLSLITNIRKMNHPYVDRMIGQKQLSEKTLQYTLDYITFGTIAVLNSWLHSDDPLSCESMEKTLANLIVRGISAVE